MKPISAAHILVTGVLLALAACGKPFPEHPAGSKEERYNRGEIRMLRSELGRWFQGGRRLAVVKGLLWLEDFVQDDGNFIFVFHNYLPMLYEVQAINPDPVIGELVRRIIRNEARRGTPYIPSIFTDGHEQDLILVIGIVERVGAPAEAYTAYYRKSFGVFNGGRCRADFVRAVKELDYDRMTDGFNDLSHFRLAFRYGMRHPLPLPPDLGGEFVRLCEAVPFRYTAADHDGYHDQNYFATHAVFFLSGYGEFPYPDHLFARRLKKYIMAHFHTVLAQVDDVDLLGEYAECMKIFGLGGREDVKKALDDIVKRQQADGSWPCRLVKDRDPYDLFHPSWTSITALHYSGNERP